MKRPANSVCHVTHTLEGEPTVVSGLAVPASSTTRAMGLVVLQPQPWLHLDLGLHTTLWA